MTVASLMFLWWKPVRAAVGLSCYTVVVLTLLSPLQANSVSSALLPAIGSSDETGEDAMVDVATERADIAGRLASVRESIDQLQSASREVPDYLAEQLELLKWHDLLLSHREANSIRKTELQVELETIEKKLDTLRASGLTDTQPQSFLHLDDVRDQLSAEKARAESIRLEIDAVQDALTSARTAHENAEKKRRLARDTLEMATDPAAKETRTREHALAQVRSRAHGEALRQEEMELEISRLKDEISRTRMLYLQEKVKLLRGVVEFSQQDLQSRLALLDKFESQFEQQLASLQESSNRVERQWLEAKRELESSTGDDKILAEKVATWKLARELQQEQVSLVKEAEAYLGLVRTYWRRRYELANGRASTEDVHKWHGEMESAREHLGRFKQVIAIRADERLGDLATLRKRLITLQEDDEELALWVQQQADELDKAINAYGSQLALIKAGQRLVDRFSEELDQAIETNTAAEWLAHTGQMLHTCWNYEIASVDDRPITVSKVIRGIILLLVGFLLARFFSRVLGRRVLPRFGMNPGASTALQTISFYMMLTVCGFFALEMINLPVTVFAFMGGAIAIGVGFGSQNVLNNFISGLILLAERPIRVGDLVDIDGLNGNIEHIGARSTRVRTGSNLEIIVPNSKFLENNVTNWTLSNTKHRTMVSVGVAYGSPTREVNRLICQAVMENEAVLKDPQPIILFKEFGDNALLFEVHFWIHMRTIMQAETVASDVRHAIDDLFDQAKITIAFPQRDVHLDATAPIEVNVRQIEQWAQQTDRRREAA